MNSRKLIHRLVIISFFVLTGYCAASSLAVKSWTGFILALVGIGAGIVFMHLLQKLNASQEEVEY